jgi:hypothetical protein
VLVDGSVMAIASLGCLVGGGEHRCSLRLSA